MRRLCWILIIHLQFESSIDPGISVGRGRGFIPAQSELNYNKNPGSFENGNNFSFTNNDKWKDTLSFSRGFNKTSYGSKGNGDDNGNDDDRGSGDFNSRRGGGRGRGGRGRGGRGGRGGGRGDGGRFRDKNEDEEDNGDSGFKGRKDGDNGM